RSAHAGGAAHSSVSVAYAEPELGADIAREAAGGSDYASFDFNFLRLAVQLSQQAVNRRHHRRNVGDDQRVGAIVGDHIAALREEFFQSWNHVLGVGVA